MIPFCSVKVIKNSQLTEYRNKTLNNPHFKGVVFSSESQIAYLNYLHRNNFSYLVCKERFANQLIVNYFQQNHYLADEISMRISWYREFGITNHIISKYIDFEFLSMQSVSDEKEALKLRDLIAVFGLWGFCLGISFASWLIEMGCGWNQQYKFF